MQYTTNLNLKKPELTDYVNVADLNDNADILDEAMSAASAITDTITLKKYKWGMESGVVFLEEVV